MSQGEAVQVESTISKLKASGTKSLKLKYDNSLSSFAFSAKLRRYMKVRYCNAQCQAVHWNQEADPHKAGRCELTPCSPLLVSAIKTNM